MLREIVAEAALYAEKIVVDATHVAVVSAQNFVIAHAKRGLAAIRTVRADSGDVFHFPRARLVTISAARERADGADVDAHAALFALEMIFAVGNDDGIRAAHSDA